MHIWLVLLRIGMLGNQNDYDRFVDESCFSGRTESILSEILERCVLGILRLDCKLKERPIIIRSRGTTSNSDRPRIKTSPFLLCSSIVP